MRKLIVVLMLAVSFTLGMVSQNLIAGNTIYPKKESNAFSLNPYTSTFSQSNGGMSYQIPNGW